MAVEIQAATDSTLDRLERLALHSQQGLMVSALLVGGSGGGGAFLHRTNFDAAWYLHVAEQVIGGQRLYVDIIEVNPPLIVWLSIVPVWLGDVTGFFAPHVFRLLILACAALILVMAARLLKSLFPSDLAGGRALFTLAMVFASLPLVLPFFGEREHLFFLLILPYLIMAAARLAGSHPATAHAVVVGLLAAVGIALKPYFLLVPLAVEFVLFMRLRTAAVRRPELAVCIIFGIIYLGAVLAAAPEYMAVRRFIPAYAVYNLPFWDLIASLHIPVVVLAVAIVAAFIGRPSGGLSALAQVLTAASIAALVVVVIQRKAWGYQFYPFLGLITLLCVVALIQLREVVADRARIPFLGRWTFSAVLGTLIVISFSRFTNAYAESRFHPEPTLFWSLVELVNEEAAGEPVLSFTTEIAMSFPLVTYAGARWTFPYPSLWALAGVIRAGGSPVDVHSSKLHDIDQEVRSAVFEDLQCMRPRLIILDNEPRRLKLLGGTDILSYLREDPRIAELLSAYHPVPDWPVGVLRRADETSHSPDCPGGRQRDLRRGQSTIPRG